MSLHTEHYDTECRHTECRYVECCYTECRYAECRYTECRYTECRYTECRGANVIDAVAMGPNQLPRPLFYFATPRRKFSMRKFVIPRKVL